MRLLTLFLFVAFMSAHATGISQKITISDQQMTFRELFVLVKKQTGLVTLVMNNDNGFLLQKNIHVAAHDMPLKDFLNMVLKDHSVEFNIVGKTIFLTGKKTNAPPVSISEMLLPKDVSGKVVDSAGSPMENVSVSLSPGKKGTFTKSDGSFLISGVSPGTYTLELSLIGHISISRKITVSNLNSLDLGILVMKISPNTMNEVEVLLNTGYYELPKERATGSFTHIDKKTLSRSTGTNILERLEGVANGLQFIRKNMAREDDDKPSLRVRGVSTIESDESPLIVVDNFPFTGDITSINPEDIQSITILKDAAAASIWGAKAGNGVIVITTMRGKLNSKATISVNSTVIVGEKPDLFYRKKWLPSPVVMGIQKESWEAGLYNESDNRAMIPAYVTLLINKRDGVITEEEFQREENIMLATDARKEALRYFYRNSVNQQHTVSGSGGSATAQYYFSAGYNKNLSDVKGNENDRLSLSIQNTFKPRKSVDLNVGLWFTETNIKNNGFPISALNGPANDISALPYMRYIDENGQALEVPRSVTAAYMNSPEAQGLLDWSFRPIDEARLADNKTKVRELRITAGVNFNILKNFNLQANYQFLQNWGNTREYYSPETFFVRDLVNQFTMDDGTKIIPYGGILKSTPYDGTVSHAARGQLNYKKRFGTDHELVALAGGEIRESVLRNEFNTTMYNYDDDKTTGTSRFDYLTMYITRPADIPQQVPGPDGYNYKLTDRDLSYFGNIAYSFKNRYSISGSARYDGSNLFGVKTNQKGTPLWSVGASWDISKEAFYNWNAFSYLRLRTTYGVSGNVNKSVSHYPTISTLIHYLSQMPIAMLTSPGNPSLRWEKVYSYNTGLDFSGISNRLSGSVDFFVKNGNDLIGNDFMAPSTGMLQYKINYASIRTTGIDLTLNLKLIRPVKQDKLSWDLAVLFNYAKNRVTSFNTNETDYLYNYLGGAAPPVAGKSKDLLYSLPFYGLSSVNGQPIVYINGQESQDYTLYQSSLSRKDLLEQGLSVPPLYGSVRSMLSWKGFTLDMNFIWKAKYVFARETILPTQEYGAYPNYHQDYLKRWQKPGDEKITNVPAKLPIGSKILNMDYAYSYTEIMYSKGDHIRLQDVNLSYNLPDRMIRKTPFNNLRLTVYAKNLGILWRANDHGIDPDMPNAFYPLQRSVSFALYTSF